MAKLFDNIMKLTDSYKHSHFKQYPPGTEYVYSYFESRGGPFDEVVFFGLQYYIDQYLKGKVVTKAKIDAAEKFVNAHMGPGTFNRDGWEYILSEHNGYLPLEICAVPEGTPVPSGNVMMTVRNTDPVVPWLTNFVETLLVEVWYPSTVATHSRELKKIVAGELEATGDVEGLPFKVHDFGFRGVTCPEQAGLGGAAHLVSFMGTDTMAGLEVADAIYKEPMAGFSIPASEHSTITSWGRENELEAVANMLKQYPEGLVACVSDSYNIYDLCHHYGTTFYDAIMNRNGTFVVRPDSGNPPEVVVKVLDILGEYFPVETNAQGYKVLDSHIRVIQGDGIDMDMILDIYAAMEFAGWSADNLAFGSGGGLLQKFDRDTCKFAFKASYIEGDGFEREVYKQPVDAAWKASKTGKMGLFETPDGYVTVDKHTPHFHHPDDEVTRTVFLNGKVVARDTFEAVRERAAIHPVPEMEVEA